MKIVVVGAGLIGLACAYLLVQDGHQVTVLDREQVGAGASYGNAAKIAVAETDPVPAPGMVAQALKWMLRSDSPLYVKPSLQPAFVRFMLSMAHNCTESRFRDGLRLHLKMACAAGDLLDEWRADGLDFQMHSRGVLLAFEDAQHFHDRLRYQNEFSTYGQDAQVLDAGGVRQVEPALSDRVRHGLFYPADRQVEPDSLTRALGKRIGELGGDVQEHVTVTGFERAGATVSSVVTSHDRFVCDLVILAAGAWTGALAGLLGMRLPIMPGKGYSLDYTPSPIHLHTSLTLVEAHVAVTPLDQMVRVAGTMEFSGFKQDVSPRRVAAISRAASRAFHAWDPEALHRPVWAGLRPMTPDGRPIIGPLTDGSNTYITAGHGMLGLTLAPATARMVRGMIRGEATADPRLSPQRFRRSAVAKGRAKRQRTRTQGT